jgi:hypothetical protein
MLFDESEHVYMWPLTFREVVPVWWCMNTHGRFVKELRKWYPKFKGLRVTEVHDMHGIHYHWLVDTWMDVELLNILAPRFGFGRLGVTEADRGAAAYLAKYMSKRGQAPMFRKLSRWGTLGGFIPSRIRDIEIQSETSARLNQLRRDWCFFHKKTQVPFDVFLRLIKAAYFFED